MMKKLIGFVLAAAFTATGANYASAAISKPATEVTDAVKQESNKLYSMVSSYMSGTNSANYNNSSTVSNSSNKAAEENNNGTSKNAKLNIFNSSSKLASSFNFGQWLKSMMSGKSQPVSQQATQPTAQPTAEPAPQATAAPTTQPTTQPTAAPIAKPTTQPAQQTTAKPTSQPTTQTVGSNYKALQDKIFELTNVERQKNGVAPFVYNAAVEKYAVAKSQDMAVNNYFDHNSPTNGYFYDIWKKDGFKYSAGAENIYYMSDGRGYTNQDINTLAQQIVTGWMNSDGHRKNILNPNLKELGVGVAVKDNRLYATQLFHTN